MMMQVVEKFWIHFFSKPNMRWMVIMMILNETIVKHIGISPLTAGSLQKWRFLKIAYIHVVSMFFLGKFTPHVCLKENFLLGTFKHGGNDSRTMFRGTQ